MNILLVNGSPDNGGTFDEYLNDLQAGLEKEGSRVTMFHLRDKRLQYCIGCFNCWVKTPGRCVHQDDGPGMLTAVINADVVVLASPLIMGFPSSLLKKGMDRFIPLIHPHFELVRGEVHHRKRYADYPLLGVLVEPESSMDDLELVKEVFSRFAVNFKTELTFYMTTELAIKEAIHEINCA